MPDLREEFEALMPEPFDYLYEFSSPFGGVERRTSPNQRNGSGPTRSVSVYAADQVRAAMQAVAERAAKKEREECAKLCDEDAASYNMQARNGDVSGASDHKADAANDLAAAIRAREGKGGAG